MWAWKPSILTSFSLVWQGYFSGFPSEQLASPWENQSIHKILLRFTQYFVTPLKNYKPISRPWVDNQGLDYFQANSLLVPWPNIVGTIEGVLTSFFLLWRSGPHHCHQETGTSALYSSTALLQFCTLHCTALLQYCTVWHYCNTALYGTTAILHCMALLQYCTVLHYCNTAVLHCTVTSILQYWICIVTRGGIYDEI